MALPCHRMPRLFHAPLHLLAGILIYRKIRAMTGGRTRVMVSGGAMLSADLDDFYEIIGYRMINGYGSNETTAVTTVRDLKRNVRHSIGAPAPGTEYKMVDPETGALCPGGNPGVLHVRGNQVFCGYYNNPEATKAVLSADGWYNTGDLVKEVLDRQFVFPTQLKAAIKCPGQPALTMMEAFSCVGLIFLLKNKDLGVNSIGRVKDTISLLDRNNVEPEPVEKLLEGSSFIKLAVIIGQDRPFLTAIIFPHKDNLKLALGRELPAFDTPGVRSFYSREITNLINHAHGFQDHEFIRDFQLMNDELKPGDLLTLTMKSRGSTLK